MVGNSDQARLPGGSGRASSISDTAHGRASHMADSVRDGRASSKAGSVHDGRAGSMIGPEGGMPPGTASWFEKQRAEADAARATAMANAAAKALIDEGYTMTMKEMLAPMVSVSRAGVSANTKINGNAGGGITGVNRPDNGHLARIRNVQSTVKKKMFVKPLPSPAKAYKEVVDGFYEYMVFLGKDKTPPEGEKDDGKVIVLASSPRAEASWAAVLEEKVPAKPLYTVPDTKSKHFKSLNINASSPHMSRKGVPKLAVDECRLDPEQVKKDQARAAAIEAEIKRERKRKQAAEALAKAKAKAAAGPHPKRERRKTTWLNAVYVPTDDGVTIPNDRAVAIPPSELLSISLEAGLAQQDGEEAPPLAAKVKRMMRRRTTQNMLEEAAKKGVPSPQQKLQPWDKTAKGSPKHDETSKSLDALPKHGSVSRSLEPKGPRSNWSTVANSHKVNVALRSLVVSRGKAANPI